MINLAKKKCVPCRGGEPTLTPEQIKEYQSCLSSPWEVTDGKKIKREFKFKDFKKAIDFINKVANIAEEQGHHPDIHSFYNKVVLELWTHAINGLHENDFIVAEKINQINAG